ncbi:phosphorylase family protein [Microbacterium hydrocarbonoxydans]|uniref:phosphorylase family protein n=1 Tax=Microbacterium hydrocarbonoxydans TaxID=273678 RepID=UPI002040C4C7|nr:nucleoside phosphorylase [Microbacterium hydrocarbonoxydans]MCM3781185.1 nucleoside phosphorylase [Microbacterium hydrocarbonoxydans]
MRLLVAAMASELEAFPDELEGFDQLVTGEGKMQATYALTRALSAKDYEEIVVVGTAGGIDPELDTVVHEIGSALQHDVFDLEGVAGQHVSLPARVSTGREGVLIATGDSFVGDAGITAVIRPSGAGLVDMETYAYIWVAQQFDVPIRAFRAISDRAEDGALVDFRAAIARCSVMLRETIRQEYGV